MTHPLVNKVVKYNEPVLITLRASISPFYISGAGPAAGAGGGGHPDLLQPGVLCREGDP